ncbi:MAG: TRAP transporter large permease subunit [Proteobacteria bacterium]|nr:TRAP transporter large permease subunit [Pseudomonadota bacterium]
MDAILYLLVPLLLLLLLGQHIAFALLFVAFIGYYVLLGGFLPDTIAMTTFNLTYNFVITAIPLFIFMGEIILRSGFSGQLYRGLSRWLQLLPGGLLHSNIGASAMFAAVCGSSVATAAAIGTVALPEMEKRGYDPKIAAGSLAAGGVLGPLIPPSIAFIIYGVITETSIVRLFMAGVFPGLLLTGMFMLYIAARAMLDRSLAPRDEHEPWRARLAGTRDILPIVGLMLLVLGGIYAGVMTPTEAAAIGASGALVMAAIARRLTWEIVWLSLKESTRATAFIMFIIVGAMLLGVVLANLRVPRALADMVLNAQLSPLMVMIAIYAMYFVMGCFFDGISMMIITLPVIFPVVTALGYDPVWFGVAFVIIMEVGLLTPPVGLNLYVIHGISKHRPFSEVAIGAAPFFVIMLVALAIIHAYPALSLWLPEVLLE